MATNLIEKLYDDNKLLSDYLLSKSQISFQSQLDDSFKKVLLLACASNLEHQITEILNEFAKKAANNCQALISFVKKKAIIRQFHTYFNWDLNNANQFFSLFGEDLLKEIKSDISNNNELDDAIKSFMEIGRIRNEMVHEDYVSFPLDKTSEDVFKLYKNSLIFISYLSGKLLDSVSTSST